MSEAKENLERLRAKRGGHRGVCTKLQKEADELVLQAFDENDEIVNRCEIIQGMLEEKRKLLERIDEDILALCDVKDIPAEIEESAEVVTRLLKATTKLGKYRRKEPKKTIQAVSDETITIQDGENSQVTSDIVENSSENNVSDSPTLVNTSTTENVNNGNVSTMGGTISSATSYKPRLPKLSLAKFKGEVTKWNTFWDSFESAIHNNNDISKIDKFNYLNSLLEGTALRAIQGLTLTGANYDAAIEILRDRFGQPQQIITAHMDELLKIPASTGDRLSSLRFIYDKISVHVRALASLGVSSDQYGSLLIPIVLSKMPGDIRLQIARQTKKDAWKIDDLLQIIKFELEAREISEATKSSEKPGLPTISHKRDGTKPPQSPTGRSLVVESDDNNTNHAKINCAYCNALHYSASCEKVKDPEARRKILGQSGRCFICLRKGHQAKSCTSTRGCRHCQRRHHQSICPQLQREPPQHPQEPPPAPRTSKDSPETVKPTITATRLSKGTVLLQTARAIATSNGKSTSVRVLFDAGSQRSYVSNVVLQRLDIKPVKKEVLHLNTFGENRFKRQNCGVYKLSLENGRTGDGAEIQAVNFPVICSPLRSVVTTNYAHLDGLGLADFNQEESDDSIDVLVGADHYWDLVTGDVVKGEDGPTAIDSKLGWLLSGPAESSSSDESTTSNLILTQNDPHFSISSTEDSKLADSLRRFWETESIGISEQQPKSDREEKVLRNIRHTGERYEVGLPWKEDRPAIENDRELCLSRLHSLHNRLKRNERLLTEYDKAIKDQLASGIVEEIPRSEPRQQENTVHYIPHHAVIREDKKTTKIRVVYDGSATTNDRKFSLNDCLPTGPNYVPQLFNVLVKFRTHRVGLIADIEKAFLMIGIEEIDRDMMRFLWFENVHDPNPKVAEFRFTRLMFGLRSSPAILGATINHHLEFYKETHPETVKTIKDSLYVDDLVSGAPKDDQAFEIYQNTKRVMSDGGFNLRKWCSNSASLVEAINKAETTFESTQKNHFPAVTDESLSYAKATTNPDSNVSKDKCAKVLGSIWDMDSDEFQFNLSSIVDYSRTLPFTKRSVLKLSSKIFDPLGLLAPFTVKMKILFQELCSETSGWDDPLSNDLKAKWKSILTELISLNNVRIRRCYFQSSAKPTSIQLHGFSDASKAAFAAVLYLRSAYEDGHVELRLVASKGRVAPIKGQSIPRLELLGATVLARLVDTVLQCLRSEFKEIKSFNWTDSMAVLCWVTSNKFWKQYVLHRVQEIQKLTSKQSWRFCPGSMNPADLPSRGIKASELVKSHTWWNGPAFLYLPETEWPTSRNAESNEIALQETVKRPTLPTHTLVTKENPTPPNISELMNCGDFSDLTKLFRVTAYVLRFIDRVKCPRKSTEEVSNVLTASEISTAEHVWIQSIQNDSFSNELEFLKCDKQRLPPNRVRQFGLFVDENRVLRCKGRIEHANLEFDSKHPILLPSKHPFVDLIIRDTHTRVKHSGIRDTLTTIRERFWVLRGRQAVKRILKQCVVCRRADGVPFATPPSPDLPPERVSDAPPFVNTGLDFVGPLFIRKHGTDSLSNDKVYILLFTCASTRGVHLELTPSLDVPSFLRAFRRFVGRRGLPSRLLSDNAKTFRAASKEIMKLSRAPEVTTYLTNNRITWSFIVEKAPWWGGFWERLVRSVKRPLKKVLGRSSLSYDELNTIIIEIESLINARPITYVFDDQESISYALSPSQLLYGRRLTSLPNDEVYEIQSTNRSLTKRARHQRNVIQQFTNRWRKEYLLNLREQSVCNSKGKNGSISVGDIVIIKNDKTNRNFWKLAMVENLLRGEDNMVRAAVVKVVGGKGDQLQRLRRPIQHLIPIEVRAEERQDSNVRDDDRNESNEEAVPEASQKRPRREAAVIGELKRIYGDTNC